jgi:hypothetical protein
MTELVISGLDMGLLVVAILGAYGIVWALVRARKFLEYT